MANLALNFETRIFLWLLLVVSVVFIWVLKPFFGPIFWACALAIIFYPAKEKLFGRFRHRRNLQAFLTLMLCLFIVILPVIFLVVSITSEAVSIYQKVENDEIDMGRYLEEIQTSVPLVQSTLDMAGIDLGNFRETAGDLAINSGRFLAQHTVSIGQNAFKLVLNFFVMLYLLFFFLREGKKLVELMIRALPMGDARERLLFTKFAEVTRATVKGNILIAIIQGTLGGIIFWILDIPAPLLWGFIMAILSLIPAVGASLIWGPVAIYLLATGSYTQGIILIVFGAGVIGLIDNILRPILVGRDTKLPDYMVLLSTLGGLALLGINGFVIGPLIAALFVVLWDIFMREINVDLSDNNEDDKDEADTEIPDQLTEDTQPAT